MHVFFPAPLLREILNYIVFAAVVTSLPFTGRGAAAVCLGLFVTGFYFIYISGSGWSFCTEAIGRNVNLLALLITVPLLGLPLKTGGYVVVLDTLAVKYMGKSLRMYIVPALFSHILGVFMNIGAVPLTYEITARGKITSFPSILARSISRGFGAALMWSPNMIATAVVLGYLAVPWQNYVYLGILFAVVSLLIGIIMELFQKEKGLECAEAEAGCSRDDYPVDRIKLGQLLVTGVIFLSIVIFIETRTMLKVIDIVPVVAIVFPAVWLALLGRVNTVKEGYGDYFRNRAGRYDGEVVLFVAAGFFSAAFSVSGWSDKLIDYIMHFSTGMASLSATILAVILIAGVFGIHPMVPVSALASSLDQASIGISPVNMALVLIMGWALGATVSPMSGTSLVVGGLTGKSPAAVGMANLFYSMLVAASVVLYMAFQ
ncbi:MAG: hypothetical protein ACOY30_02675 [Bacillota bacterium]